MHKSDRTRAAFKFEAWIPRNVACPNCGTFNLRKAPVNFGHLDAICMDCAAGVSVKRTAHKASGNYFRAAPASKGAYVACVKLFGAHRLFVLTGNEKGFKFYSYSNHFATEIAPRRGEVSGRVILTFAG